MQIIVVTPDKNERWPMELFSSAKLAFDYAEKVMHDDVPCTMETFNSPDGLLLSPKECRLLDAFIDTVGYISHETEYGQFIHKLVERLKEFHDA